jgi:hypothetical protein
LVTDIQIITAADGIMYTVQFIVGQLSAGIIVVVNKTVNGLRRIGRIAVSAIGEDITVPVITDIFW